MKYGFHKRCSNLEDIGNIGKAAISTITQGALLIRFANLRILVVVDAPASGGKIAVLEEPSDYPTDQVRCPMSYGANPRKLGILGINDDGAIVAFDNIGPAVTTNMISGLAIWVAVDL